MLFMDGPLLTHEVYYYSAAAAASNERKEKEKIEIEIAVLCCAVSKSCIEKRKSLLQLCRFLHIHTAASAAARL